MKYLLKNSAGDEDGMWTICFLSWIIVSFVFVVSMFEGDVSISENIHFTINPPDFTMFSTYLGATVTGYIVRRNKKQDSKNDSSSKDS